MADLVSLANAPRAPGTVITQVDLVQPRAHGALSLVLAKSPLGDVADAGLTIGVGDPAVCVTPVPDCGCDACDMGSRYSMMATRAHIRTLYEVGDDELGPMLGCLRDVSQAVELAAGFTGTTIRQNNNPPGQEIDHLHFHIVPRFPEDDYRNAEAREVDMQCRPCCT